MNSTITRPPSVWLTQTLLIIFALLWFGIMVLNLLTPRRADVSIFRVVIAFLLILLFVILLVVAFWGLARRHLYGKWLGLISLIIIWALIVYSQLFPATGPHQKYEYDNAAQLAGAFLTLSLIHALFGFLIVRFAFSKKVNQFFRKKEDKVAD